MKDLRQYFRLRRGEFPGLAEGFESLNSVVPVTERLIVGKSTAAKGYHGSSRKAILISGGIEEGEIALDADGTIIDHCNFRGRHS